MKKETTYTRDGSGKKLFVVREFNAPLEEVWKAWTEQQLLDEWWAPKPWKTRTKSMDFREGGQWLYAMLGPQGEQHWCFMNFKKIEALKSFSSDEGFCDEQGNINNDFPVMHWRNSFSVSGEGTRVEVEIDFDSPEDLEKIVEMGFKEGFAMAHDNLDKLLVAAHSGS